MFGAYDLPNRSSAVTADTVRRLGYRPSRRVQIETVGRSRRRRHRGGTVEQDRARAERAAARAQFREPEPEPESDDDDSGSENFDDSRDIDVGALFDEPAGVLREDPLETPRAGVDRPLPDDEFKPIPFFQAVYDQAVQNGVDMTVPSYYYAEMRSGIESELTNAQTQLAAYEELARDLERLSGSADEADEREYFRNVLEQDLPRRVQAIKDRFERRHRPFGDVSAGPDDDVRLQPRSARRGSYQRSPSPIRTPGFEESGRFSDEASTVSTIRELRESLLADPRNDAEVAALRGELDATQSMLRDIQRADAGTRRDTIKALQDLGDASRRQIVKDRKLDPSEVSIVARNISDRPAVRELLSRGMVRPNDLVSEEYAAQLQRQADSARKLPQRRSSKQPMLTRQSVPSRKTGGLTYYRRAQHVRPNMFRQ